MFIFIVFIFFLLFADEMRNRRKFYRERPHYIKPNNSESVGEVSGERKIYINDENITFSLVYHTGTISGNAGDCFREISPPIQVRKNGSLNRLHGWI